jgi:signal transduction histidine kinase
MHPEGKPTYEELRDRLDAAEKTIETLRRRSERQSHDWNQTLERRVSERTAEAEQRMIRLQKLAGELSGNEERDRQRIAGILQDDLQQVLAALRYRLNMLASSGPLNQIQENHFDILTRQIDACIEKSRGLSHELSPPTLRHNGLVSALRWLSKDMKEKHGLKVTLDANFDADPRSAILPHVLYRAVRELLFNCRKHSGDDAVHIVAGREGDRIVIRVEDAGKGMDPAELKQCREKAIGLGLFAIEERIRFLGGEIDIDCALGKGFRVTIRIPDQGPDTERELSAAPDQPISPSDASRCR